jgi:cytochrome c
MNMKRHLNLFLGAVLFLNGGVMVFAADKGTAEEAKAMLDKATAHLAAVGSEKALADFSSDKATFVDRDLYLFCFAAIDGKWTAHGANKALIGRDLTQVKDANGKQIGAEMMELSRAKGEGWVDYMWQNPETKKIEAKSSVIRRVGDQVCGVGIYK